MFFHTMARHHQRRCKASLILGANWSVARHGHAELTCREIDLSILRLAIRSKHGRSRLSRKRSRRPLQFLHSWVGTIAPRPVVHGDSAVLSGGDSLVHLARMDHPSLVDSRCGSVQAATIGDSAVPNRAIGVRRVSAAGRRVSRMDFY